MRRTGAERRHHRERIIKRRLRIVVGQWQSPDNLYAEQPGRLAKYNLDCTCWFCKLGRERYRRERLDWRQEAI